MALEFSKGEAGSEAPMAEPACEDCVAADDGSDIGRQDQGQHLTDMPPAERDLYSTVHDKYPK